jgi:hypothetical protein
LTIAACGEALRPCIEYCYWFEYVTVFTFDEMENRFVEQGINKKLVCIRGSQKLIIFRYYIIREDFPK